VILVHGGNRTSWWWHRVVPRLQSPAVAIDLPGRGGSPADLSAVTLDDCATSVLHAMDTTGGQRFALVAHSLGALTVLEVARRATTRVSSLVFIASSIPPRGQTVLGTMPIGARLAQTLALGSRPRAAPSPPRWLARQLFCNDMDRRTANDVLNHLVADTPSLRVTPSGSLDALRGIPMTYVKTSLDRAVRERRQERSIRVLCTVTSLEIVTIDGGHDSLISRPTDIAGVVNGVLSH
jgi:pimeloyl-ACP methyl ester carboxylesterase